MSTALLLKHIASPERKLIALPSPVKRQKARFYLTTQKNPLFNNGRNFLTKEKLGTTKNLSKIRVCRIAHYNRFIISVVMGKFDRTNDTAYIAVAKPNITSCKATVAQCKYGREIFPIKKSFVNDKKELFIIYCTKPRAKNDVFTVHTQAGKTNIVLAD